MSDPRPPRDWLLARHARATTQLDALRRSALPAPDLTWREILAALFHPHRAAWRALVVAWLVMATVYFVQTRTERSSPHPRPSPDALADWLRQLQTHETLAQIDRHP